VEDRVIGHRRHEDTAARWADKTEAIAPVSPDLSTKDKIESPTYPQETTADDRR
jgi:hypothetical protein